MSVTPERLAQLTAGLGRVRARISEACAGAGRDPGDLTLVVVTKTRPVDDVMALAGLGVRDVGENRDQEAAPKHAACAEAEDPAVAALRWHFIGQLQTNKARSVARYADLVHSVDRLALVTALDAAAHRADRVVQVLLQVSLDDAPGRGGAAPADLPALADAVASSRVLRLRGLMAVAPVGVDPRRAFARLPDLRDGLVRAHPGADLLSAGMSGDLEAAVAHGATHLRVGSAILGERPPLG